MLLCASMQGHIVQIRRDPPDFYLVVCDRAEALAFARATLKLESDVGCEIVGGLSDAEVRRRELEPFTIHRL